MTTTSNAIQVKRRRGQTDGEALADALLSPEIRAAGSTRGIQYATPGLALAVPDVVNSLKAKADAVVTGDLTGIERTLATQVNTLDVLFNVLLERGMGCKGLDEFKATLALALRAQRQCAQTGETLAALKYPGATFVGKQINQSNGPMQVNNGMHAPVREQEIRHNEVLGVTHERIERPSRARPPAHLTGRTRAYDEGGRICAIYALPCGNSTGQRRRWTSRRPKT